MSTLQMPIRVAIADDHEIFREGLKLMFQKKTCYGMELVSESENGLQLINEVRSKRPDVVITDIKMPVMDGLDASRIISESFPSIGIIALSTFDDSSLIYDMFEAGAKGYLLKNTHFDEMEEAITTVSKGCMFYCSATSKSLIRLIGPSKYNCFIKSDRIRFTENEIGIIKLICKQLTTKEIADQLSLSKRTVEDYSKKIKDKIDAKNIVGIAMFAIKNDIVKMSDLA